jgi:molybdopterin molybdotransferase
MPRSGIAFALPGNPFSCLVTFTLFIDFFLSSSFGLDIPAVMKLPLNTSRSKRTNMDEFFPVRMASNSRMLEALATNGSGDIRLGLNADGLGIHPSECETLNEGELIEFRRFG